MATGKRFYWIKLKESFMNSDTVDYLMSQPNGANYVVLYQLLCLKTINTGGRLARKIGEIIIPFDVEKIQRDCKWFPADTIRIALNLYRSFGLIYEDVDGTLVLADHGNLVGSETDYAQKNRRIRANQQALPNGHNVSTDVSDGVSDGVSKNVATDIRDKEIKRLETRDQEEESSIVSDETICRPQDVRRVVEAWNSLNLQNIRKVPDASSKLGRMLRARIREYGVDGVLEAVEKVRASDFLMGKTGGSWNITLEWFSRPNNFPKVINGNYDNKERQRQPNTGNPFFDALQEDGYEFS